MHNIGAGPAPLDPPDRGANDVGIGGRSCRREVRSPAGEAWKPSLGST